MLARNPERAISPTSFKVPEITPLGSPVAFPKRGSLSFSPENKITVFSPIELSSVLRVNHRLEEAKFYARMEMARFISDINLSCSQGKSLEEAVALSEKVFEEHMKAYDAEIIQQRPVLAHLNRFGMWNGSKRMLGNNGRPTVDGVSGIERGGAVKRASAQVEEFMLNGENNSYIVLMSPQGVSGYFDENGQDVPHLNTQTMVFWKNQNGVLKGMTIVTDLTIDQAEGVMEDLGAPANFFSKKGPEMARVAQVVENLATPSLPEAYKNPFEYVFDKILARRGMGQICLKQKEGVELRSVAEIREDIAGFESLLNISLTKEKYLAEFRELVLNNPGLIGDPIFQQRIVAKAEETVLLLAEDYLRKKDPSVYNERPISQNVIYQSTNLEDRFARVLDFLETRAGCPTGLAGALGGNGMASGGTLTFESDDMGSLEFFCPKCKGKNRRPRGEFVKNCQKCGTDKVYCKPTKQPKGQEEELAKAA